MDSPSRQLEDGIASLSKICDSLLSRDPHEIPSQTVQRDLGIEFSTLDIHTGATHDSVTPCFLPRADFPSLKDMKWEGHRRDGDFQDVIMKVAHDMDKKRYWATLAESKHFYKSFMKDLFHYIAFPWINIGMTNTRMSKFDMPSLLTMSLQGR